MSHTLPLNAILQHNAGDPWPLPDKSVHCIVTSPPYWGLRDYGVSGQLGLEKSPEEYIDKMVQVFREAKRILRDDGTLWINIGDSYFGGGRGSYGSATTKQKTNVGSLINSVAVPRGMKSKDLAGIPWMLAFALRADGWYLRQDIIWSKPNPMPESVTDRCTRAHEFIFMFTKRPKYYYDFKAIKTPAIEHGLNPSHWSDGTKKETLLRQRGKIDKQRGHSRRHAGFNDRWDNLSVTEQQSIGANKRSVWTVPPASYEGAHFATFPPELIVDCIKAGSPRGGIILDPFMGSGTTALVARKLDRNFIGLELNPEYIAMAEARLQKELGLFNT